MELDDYKKAWKESKVVKQASAPGVNEIIKLKMETPFSDLKRRFRKSLILLPAVMLILVMEISMKHSFIFDIFFWMYLLVWLFICITFVINYRALKRMEVLDEQVKPTLLKQLNMIDKLVKWRLTAVRLFFVALCIAFEWMINYHNDKFFTWSQQPFAIRIATYIAGLTAIYFLTGFIVKHKYLDQLNKLKGLAQELE